MNQVAVTIVTYNSALVIGRCLHNLQKQTYRNFSICVVDNASTDRTVSIVRQYAAQCLINKTNMGYAVGHNLAIAHTKSRYVLTLNPDVFLHPLFIDSMVRVMDALPLVGSASGLLLRINSARDKQSFVVDSAGLYMKSNGRQGLRFENMNSNLLPPILAPIFGPDGAAAFYRRTMLKHIAIAGEIFDEDFFMHKEDVDIAWRAKRAGWMSVFNPHAQALHIRTFRPGKRDQVSGDVKMFGLRNRYLLLLKNGSFLEYISKFIPIFIYDIGVFIYVLVKEHTSLPAYASAIRLTRKILQKRFLSKLIRQHK